MERGEDDRRSFLVVSRVGGVGKTIVAALLGLCGAASGFAAVEPRGKAAPRLADFLKGAEAPFSEVRVGGGGADGEDLDSLTALLIEGERCVDVAASALAPVLEWLASSTVVDELVENGRRVCVVAPMTSSAASVAEAVALKKWFGAPRMAEAFDFHLVANHVASNPWLVRSREVAWLRGETGVDAIGKGEMALPRCPVSAFKWVDAGAAPLWRMLCGEREETGLLRQLDPIRRASVFLEVSAFVEGFARSAEDAGVAFGEEGAIWPRSARLAALRRRRAKFTAVADAKRMHVVRSLAQAVEFDGVTDFEALMQRLGADAALLSDVYPELVEGLRGEFGVAKARKKQPDVMAVARGVEAAKLAESQLRRAAIDPMASPELRDQVFRMAHRGLSLRDARAQRGREIEEIRERYGAVLGIPVALARVVAIKARDVWEAWRDR